MRWGKASSFPGFCNPVSSAAEAPASFCPFRSSLLLHTITSDLSLLTLAAALPAESDPGECFMEHISALHLMNLNRLARDWTPERCW